MQLEPFGRTGLKISRFTLGAMNFSHWGQNDPVTSARIIHRALDLGINAIDTSDNYAAGESEEQVGLALRGRRQDVILATKFSRAVNDRPNQQGNSRRWIFEAVENSLRRLGTDYIDLYQVHRPLPDTDIDETIGALTDLVRQGKIRYYGTSNFAPSSLVETLWTAEVRHRERPVSEQPPYSILARAAERDLFPTALRHRIAILTWSPLAAGWLAGRYTPEQTVAVDTPRALRQPGRHDQFSSRNSAKADAVAALTALAKEAGLTLIELALGFVQSHPAVTSILIGPRSVAHLDAQIGAAGLKLSTDVLEAIDRIVPPGITISADDEAYFVQQSLAPSVRRG